ncbi:unnamed protein product [marine sediment metagenome]|uniref:Uncharacterized protein n=1 Tax=marine sediment metagenome TaxID=412755 RepID=X1D306_9ZZZZ
MDAVQFEIIITLLTFIFFFTVGYFTDNKTDEGSVVKSSGFILMFSGFVFLYLEYILIANSIMNIYYVVSLMSVFGLYFIILGIYKAFYSK